jgi:hypothetical protein
VENECQDIVEKSAPPKQKKIQHRVEAINVEALTTLRTLGCTNWRKMVVVNLDQLANNEGTARASGLTEGAVGAVGE